MPENVETITREDDNTSAGSNNNVSESENDFPWWAWYKAFQDIVNEKPPDYVPDPPVAVLPWLYLAPFRCVGLGDGSHAENLHTVLGITHVLSTNRMQPNVSESLYWELKSHEIDQHYIAADDQLSYNMMGNHWEESRDFLQTCLEQGGKALVHCAAGMNRSGTIAAAAMMHFEQMPLLNVARELKAKRGYVLSNKSFVKQLVQFAAREGHLGEKPERYNDDEPKENDDDGGYGKEEQS